MIDTDKYEPTQIDWILHQTREHTPEPWYSLSRSWFKHIPNISGDDALLIEYAPTLRAEVKRLREVNDEIDSFACLVREYFGDDLKELYDLYNSEGHNHLHRLFTGEEE